MKLVNDKQYESNQEMCFCGQSFETRSGMQRYCSEACQAESKRARAMQKNNLFKLAQPLMEIQHQEYLTFPKQLSSWAVLVSTSINL